MRCIFFALGLVWQVFNQEVLFTFIYGPQTGKHTESEMASSSNALTLEYREIPSAILNDVIGFRERERLSLSAFFRTEDIGVHIVHVSRLIITYTLE